MKYALHGHFVYAGQFTPALVNVLEPLHGKLVLLIIAMYCTPAL